MPPRDPYIAPILAAHGVAAGPEGYAWSELMALAVARGWHVSVEPAARGSSARRYRALVWTTDGSPFDSYSSRGRGATEEAALAHALAVALRHQS